MKKLLVILIFLPVLVGINNLTDGFRIPAAGGSARIYAKDGGSQGLCYTIQNNHATNDLYVPTKSTAEWLSFAAHTPSFATKTLCQPKSCLEIKNLMGSPADGYYTIDSDGAGANASYSAYCDMTADGGGWTRIFYHHLQGGLFATPSEAVSINIGTPSADKYSVLNKIPDFVTSGKYQFRHTWPGYAAKNIWLQSTNPLDDVDPAGVVPIKVNVHTETKLYNWGGLELSNGTHGPATTAALLDGSIEHVNWFFGIGATVPWGSPSGFPIDSNYPSSGYGVSATALWIKDEATYTSYNSCKAILDAGASNGSGLYTIDPGNLGSPIPVYCDMSTDGGGWTRVFYHTVSGGTLFADNTEAQNSNQTQPTIKTKYSILNRLTGFQRSGQYELRINWPGSGSSIRNWWTQTSNFVSTPVSGYASVSVQAIGASWQGLEPDLGNQTMSDGSAGGGWWYAIGQKVAWGLDPGAPAAPDVSPTGVPAVELWMK